MTFRRRRECKGCFHRYTTYEVHAHSSGEAWPFERGDKIVKVNGHSFGSGDAEVVVCYRNKAGDWRVVAEHPEGWQFIFTPGQIALAAQS